MTDAELQDGIQKLKTAIDERDALRAELAELKAKYEDLVHGLLDPNALQALADLFARAAA